MPDQNPRMGDHRFASLLLLAETAVTPFAPAEGGASSKKRLGERKRAKGREGGGEKKTLCPPSGGAEEGNPHWKGEAPALPPSPHPFLWQEGGREGEFFLSLFLCSKADGGGGGGRNKITSACMDRC